MSKRKSRELPTQARLQELFDYRDGWLYFKVNLVAGGKNKFIGEKAGYPTANGRIALRIDGYACLVHRLVWAWHFGQTPVDMDVHHINGDRSDNRIENLRLASHSNTTAAAGLSKSNTSGLKGVSFCTERGKWVAQITVNYRNIPLGRFDTKEQAHAVYCAAADKYFGVFANFGISSQYVRPPQKDAPPSSEQMTGRAGARGKDTMAHGLKEANHNVSLTDQAPAVQVQEQSAHIAVKRQTEVVEAITGTRFCKSCAGHRKSDGGTYLRDALSRRYRVCQTCTNSFHGDRGDSASADAERVAP